MTSRIPIVRASQLNLLNDKEVIEGYMYGRVGNPEPDLSYSYSFWHGWKNGATDGGYRPLDQSSAELARDFINR